MSLIIMYILIIHNTDATIRFYLQGVLCKDGGTRKAGDSLVGSDKRINMTIVCNTLE